MCAVQALLISWPTLMVSALYCLWAQYRQAQVRKDRRLRERVAFLLWVMATETTC
jgi:hypothetical protein